MFLAHNAVKSSRTHACKAIFTVCERTIHAGSSIKAEAKGTWSSNCKEINIKKPERTLANDVDVYLELYEDEQFCMAIVEIIGICYSNYNWTLLIVNGVCYN